MRLIPPPFTLAGADASLCDVASLVFGDVSDVGWSQVTPAQAVGLSTSANGLAQPDGLLDQVLCNYGGNAYGSGVLERPFQVPTNVSQVQLAVSMCLPAGVASASVQLQITQIYPASSTLTTSTVALTASFATYTTAAVAVSASGGTGAPIVYLARIVLNATNNQAKALIARAAVQVVSSTDSFWLQPFLRVEPLPHTLRNNGYANKRIKSAWGVPAYYWFVTPHSQLEFDTNALTLAIEWVNDINSVPGSAQFRIDVNGRFYQLVDLSGATNTAGVSKVILPAGLKRVTVANGGFTGAAAPTSLAGVSICLMTGIYLNAGAFYAHVQLAPSRGQVVVYGDSKACGQLATSVLVSGVPALLRRKYPGDVAIEAWGDRHLADESLTSVTAQAALLAAYKGDTYVIAIGRNDWQGQAASGPWATAAAFGTRYAQMLDAIHANVPGAQIVVALPSSETSEGNDAQGWSLADARAQIAGAFATRTTFAKIVDLASLWPNGAGCSAYTADGVHPNDLGQALTADALLGPDGLGITQGPLTSPLSIPGCKIWTPAMAAVVSAGVIQSVPDLSGNGNSLVPLNSPTFLAADVNGHPAMTFVGGSSQTLSSALGAILFTTSFTILVVQKFDGFSPSNPHSFQVGTDKPSDINGVAFWATGDVHRAVFYGGVYAEDTSSTGPSTNYEIIAITWVNGQQVAMQLNGVAQTMQPLTSFVANDAASRVTLGGSWNDTAYSNFFTGKIADFMSWNNVISAAALTATTRWLGAKYGISVP